MEDEAFIWYLTNWDFEKETYPVYYINIKEIKCRQQPMQRDPKTFEEFRTQYALLFSFFEECKLYLVTV